MAHRDYFWDRSGRRIKRAPKPVEVPRLTHGGGGVFGGTGRPPTPPASTLPIVNNDGTTTQSILDSAHRLILKNVLNAGSVLLSQIILDSDGTAYFEARNGEIVISSFGGAVQDARLDAGSGDAYCRSQSSGGVKSAQLVVGGALAAEVDTGTYSQATFHVGHSSAGWAAIFETLTTPAPNGDLTTSDFTMWLDDTPGSAAIRFKAKDSAGTVVTGSIPLT